jgi:hypothetical protein
VSLLPKLCGAAVLTVAVMSDFAGHTQVQAGDPLAPYRAQRDAFVDAYRVAGRIERERLIVAANELAVLVQNSSAELLARALLELGTVQRLSNDFTGAVATFGKAAQQAISLGLADVVFDAWIGIARAHEYGTSDHGAAAAALDRAIDAAGEQPSAKQRADVAGYLAQLEIGRGETEAGLINALQAVSLATRPEDRFYAELDLADGLQKLAQSCDYRPLRDAKSTKDGSDTYAACRRAVAATRTAYERALATATALGWTHLANETQGFIRRLELRRQLIEQRARGAGFNFASVFNPRSTADVLVSREFESGASTLTETPLLADLVESVVAEADARNAHPDARSLYLRGLAKDIRHAGANASAQYFAAAAELLRAERSGFFDLRRRGTVIENRGEIVRDLALRLLALRHEADAFATFESVRARGLGELVSVMARPDVTGDDRAWLAGLLVLEARAGALEHSIVGNMVASGELDASNESLRQLEDLRTERRARLRANEAARARFTGEQSAPPANLDALRAAATLAGIPVLLYWTTFGNVVAWYVGPEGSEARNVFLPESVLEEKIGRVLASSGGTMGDKPFDEAAARELFLFLIAPFTAQLNASAVQQIMIVPQGPLVQLPFEALIDPGSLPLSSIAGPFPTLPTRRWRWRCCNGRLVRSETSPRWWTCHLMTSRKKRRQSEDPAPSYGQSAEPSCSPAPGRATVCTCFCMEISTPPRLCCRASNLRATVTRQFWPPRCWACHSGTYNSPY